MKNNTIIEGSNAFNILAYFNVFKYPLTVDEIYRYSKNSTKDEIENQLQELLESEIVYKIKQYYCLLNEPLLIENREEGNQRTLDFTKKANRRAKLIAKFPYVKAVFISGSFSKGYMPIDGDVDYFIITKNNRLWLSRTLLILYKKIFLFNSRKYFCLNYFIGEDELKIDQNNIFTATEIFTLKPIINKELYEKLIKKNQWIDNYYEIEKIKTHNIFKYKKSVLQFLIEPIFNTIIGDKIDIFLMKITLKRWERKFPELPKVDFNIAFKSTRNVSKHHPSNFQKKVLESYNNTLNKMKNA